MFVRMDVVGIVGPHPVVLNGPTSEPVMPLLATPDNCRRRCGPRAEQRVDVGVGHRPGAAVLVVEPVSGAIAKVVAPDRGEIVFRHLEAEGPKNRVATTSAPVAISGFDGGSNLTK